MISDAGRAVAIRAGIGPKMKTARFSEMVARSGRPEIHLSWTEPTADRTLQAANKQSRVLTVHQKVRGAQKDFGVVGIEPGRDVQFLVFPKSLRRYAGRHVVGIRYDLLDDAPSVGTKPAGRGGVATHSHVVSARPRKTKAEVKLKKKSVPSRRPLPKAEVPAEPIAFEPATEDNDPVKSEIRRALTDLSMGHVTKAKRRLTALLRAPAG